AAWSRDNLPVPQMTAGAQQSAVLLLRWATGKGLNSIADSPSSEVSSLIVWFSSRPSPPQAAKESDSKRSKTAKIELCVARQSFDFKNCKPTACRSPAGQ